MIVTEQQRRWWFATHPEFSWSNTGEGTGSDYDDDDADEGAGRPSPESVDAWADERLTYETDNVRRTLVELAKFYFGTEFQSKTPAEKEAILKEDEDATWDDDELSNAEGNDWWSQQPADTESTDGDAYLSYKDVLDHLEADEWRRFQEAIEHDKKGLIADPHTFLDLLPYRRLLISPIQVLRGLLRNSAEGAVVRAAKKGGTRWRVGDDVLVPTPKGVEPSWTTQARRHWKNEAAREGAVERWGAVNVERMRRGLAPQRINRKTNELESRELHHDPVPQRHGGKEYIELWPPEHAAIDPQRRLKKR